MLRKLIATSSTWTTVPLRLAMAVVFIAHGSGKVLGSFGGPGFKAFISEQTPFPFMRPAWLWLAAAALSELVGGVLLLLGFLTRIGAFLIACVMLTAIVGVHSKAFFLPSGMEYALTIFAVAIALLISGGGAASIDRALSGGRRTRRSY
jgi:putative oxidoreductase